MAIGRSIWLAIRRCPTRCSRAAVWDRAGWQTASIPYLNPGDRAAHVAVLVGGPFRNQHVLPWRRLLGLAESNPAVMAALLVMARRDGRAAVHAGIGEADAFGWFGHLGVASFDFGLLRVDFHEVAAGLLVREQSRDFSPFSPLAINLTG